MVGLKQKYISLYIPRPAVNLKNRFLLISLRLLQVLRCGFGTRIADNLRQIVDELRLTADSLKKISYISEITNVYKGRIQYE